MRKYIAFHNSSNSGIQTREKAIEWGANILNIGKVASVHLCEVVDVIERDYPPVTVRAYLPPTEESSQLLPKVKVADGF